MKNRKFIKLKKVVKGLDEKDVDFSNVYVQITQDKTGTSISLNEYTISLTKLGYKIVKDN